MLRGIATSLVALFLCLPLHAQTKIDLPTQTKGILPAANGGAGTVSGALKGDGSGAVSQAACSDLSNGATGCSTATGTSGATIPLLNGANTWSGVQSINSGNLGLKGATSGTTTLNAAATAGTTTITLPGGTTDFSATGGTSQVVKQTSSGGAFSVGRLACADLSDSSTGCSGSGGGTPGGSSLTIQYNNASALGGMSGTSWDDANRSLTFTGATITASHPVFDLSQIWNSSGTTFTGLKLNVTSTASASASLLMDLQVGGTSQFKVDKSGGLTVTGAVNAGSNSNINAGYAAITNYIQASDIHSVTNSPMFVGATVSGAFGAYLQLNNNSVTSGDGRSGWRLTGNAIGAFDIAPGSGNIAAAPAYASAVTNLVGGAITITAGDGASGSSGAAHGGNVTIAGGTGYGTGHKGYIILSGLPTSASGLPSGALWNNSGVLSIAP